MHEFGAELRQRRKAAGLSLRALAELANFDYSYLGHVERGRPCSRHLARRCDDLLGCDGALLAAFDEKSEVGDHPPGIDGRLGDSVTAVIELGRDDVNRRRFLTASSGSALAALLPVDSEAVLRRINGTGTKVGQGEIAAIGHMVRALGDAAAELGGGHARHLAVRYLTEDVARWLDGRYTETVGRGLFAATSQLVHLVGWMAADEGEQGLAQSYYLHAYRLAAEAEDPELSATALRGLAVQSIDLGYRATAVRLAEACTHYANNITDTRVKAYYQATLANAAAHDGDKRTARAALASSQTSIERASGNAGSSWASHYSTGRWAHESGMILADMGELREAAEHVRLAIDIHGLDRRRSRASALADLGQICLRQGDYDGAVSTWGQFMDCSEGLQSVKVSNAVTDMRARLGRVRQVRGVKELLERSEDQPS